jgi:3-dehydroquinate dehydratase I
MTRTLPAKICASIAANTASLMQVRADEALSHGADFVELRFDYMKPEELAAAIGSADGIKQRAVFTLRSKAQGGRFVGSEHDRLDWLRKIVERRPMLVDIELETLKGNDEFADFIDGQKTPILVSWHDFNGTPPAVELADILSEMRVYSNFVKMVTTAKGIADALRLLKLYESTIGLNAIIFAMGEAGVISRVLCTLVGNAPFTYASLDEAIAPGQLTVPEMRKLYDMLENRPNG